MRKIKTMWPDHQLVLVCRQGVGEFFKNTHLVDHVCEVKKGDGTSYKQALERLGKFDIDNVFSPHESLRTAFFVGKIKAAKKISFRKGWNGFFFDVLVKKNLQLPDAIRQLSLLADFDAGLKKNIETYAREAHPYEAKKNGHLPSVPLWASMSLKSYYSKHLAEVAAALEKFKIWHPEKAVAIFPGSVWATKRWTEEGFVQVGQKLREQGINVVVMGGPGEEELCAKIASQIPDAKDISGQTTIFESALILSQVAAVVGNDSASLHLAATAETPSVVIFGPTILQFGYRPWQDQVFVVEKKDLVCRPCGKHGHKECPLKTHVCMTSLSKQDVLEKLEAILPYNLSR